VAKMPENIIGVTCEINTRRRVKLIYDKDTNLWFIEFYNKNNPPGKTFTRIRLTEKAFCALTNSRRMIIDRVKHPELYKDHEIVGYANEE